jgi:hypothetical protein
MKLAKILGIVGVLVLMLAALLFFAPRNAQAQFKRKPCPTFCLTSDNDCRDGALTEFQTCMEGCSNGESGCIAECKTELSTALRDCASALSSCIKQNCSSSP